MWFKKKSVLQTGHHYDTEKSADGSTDLRTTWRNYSNNSSSSLPSAADAGNYFYLPALGCYQGGYLVYIGDTGRYWSSSASPWQSISAFYLHFDNSGDVYVGAMDARNYGMRVGGFK